MNLPKKDGLNLSLKRTKRKNKWGCPDLTATDWDYRYAGRMVIYFLNKLGRTINVEKSNITVGDNGNIDALLSSLSYELESELALA